jgi:hypothetical protein
VTAAATPDADRLDDIASHDRLSRDDQTYLHGIARFWRLRDLRAQIGTIGTTEASKRLGLKSISTVKRWAERGLLEERIMPSGRHRIVEASVKHLERRFEDANEANRSGDFRPRHSKRTLSRRSF